MAKGKQNGQRGGGNKPAIRMVAKHKETGSRVDLGAGWVSDRFPGTYNFRLEEGVRIKAADRDGLETVITRDSHYIDLEPPRGARRDAEDTADAEPAGEVDF